MEQEREGVAFGQMAVRLKLLTPEQLRECLHIQRKMTEMGVPEQLGRILVKKGYLNESQVGQVLRALGAHTVDIPGLKIIDKVAQGGMGTIYKARQTSVDRIVAVKILSSLATQDKAFVQRFLSEARAAARLSHKNIITVFDCGESNGTYYYVMEFIDGLTLRDVLRRGGPFNERMACEHMLQVCEALQYLHEHALVHRDIKPENLMLTSDGIVKLCDFGLAKSLAVDQSLTQSGFVVGTPYYMSPEQINGARVDIRSDLYSLGATLYHLVTGTVPFAASSLPLTLQKHLTEKPVDPRKYNPKLSAGFVAIILKLLEKDPARRYQTPRQLAEDFRCILTNQAPAHARPCTLAQPPRVITRRTPTRTGPKRRLAIFIGLVAGAVVLLAAAGIVAFLSSGAPAIPPPKAPPSTPPAFAEPPRPLEPAGDPPEDLAEAKLLIAKGDDHFSKSQWVLARNAYEDALKRYGHLKYMEPRREALSEKLTRCVSEIDRLAAEVNQAYEQARAHEEAGRYEEAALLYKKVLEANLPSSRYTPARVREALASCGRESAAKTDLDRIEDHYARGEWSATREAIRRFFEQHRSTRLFGQKKQALDERDRKAFKEEQAVAQLARVHAAAIDRQWEQLQIELREFHQNFADTRTYASSAEKLKEYDRVLWEANRTLLEQEAERKFNEAQSLLASGKYADALQAFTALGRYAQSDSYRNRQAEIQNAIAECGRKLKEAQQKEAEDWIRRARAEHKAKNWDELAKILERLQTEYGDTLAVKSNKGQIAGFQQDLEKFRALYALRFEFEDTLGNWEPESKNNPPPAADYAGEACQGKNAAKLSFTGAGGEPHRLWLSTGPMEGAERLQFYAKLARARKGELCTFHVILREGEGDEHWGLEIKVGGDWMLITLPFSSFQRRYPMDEEPRELNLDLVSAIGFEPANTERQVDLLIDALRVQKKP